MAHALRRFGAALTIGIALGFAVARANAQAPVLGDSARAANLARIDSLLAQVDSLLARTRVVPTRWTMVITDDSRRDTKAYAAMIGVALAANTVLKIDRDPCPSGKRVCFSTDYTDRWIAADKFNHANVAYFLTSGAMKGGVPPAWAAGLTCGLAGVGFELTQGYVSRKDIVADCAGAGLAVALRNVGAKARAAGWFR